MSSLVSIKSVTKYYHHGGARVAMRKDGEVYYLHGDHLGSTSLTTDANGAVVSEGRYHPFGSLRWQNGVAVTDFTFTSQRADSFGLLDYNARYYDSVIGRFISADTIVPDFANPQALNRYSYTGNNPVGYNDPTGHSAPINCWICDVKIDISNWSKGTKSLATVVAPIAGLHVNSDKTAIVGPTPQEWADDAVLNLMPNPMTVVQGPVRKGLANAGKEILEEGFDEAGEAAGKIYRSASGTADSLTPRPGIDDVPNGGLSFFDSLENPGIRPGGKYVEVDPNEFNRLSAIADNDPPGHISVRPASLSKLREWATTRGTGEIHRLTQELLDAIAYIDKKPK